MTVQIYTQEKLRQLYRLTTGGSIRCGSNAFTAVMEDTLPENRRIFVYRHYNRLLWTTPRGTWSITEEMIESILVE